MNGDRTVSVLHRTNSYLSQRDPFYIHTVLLYIFRLLKKAIREVARSDELSYLELKGTDDDDVFNKNPVNDRKNRLEEIK